MRSLFLPSTRFVAFMWRAAYGRRFSCNLSLGAAQVHTVVLIRRAASRASTQELMLEQQ